MEDKRLSVFRNIFNPTVVGTQKSRSGYTPGAALLSLSLDTILTGFETSWSAILCRFVLRIMLRRMAKQNVENPGTH